MSISPQKQFDFEAGTLRQSPCKTCVNRNRLPKCINNCQVIKEVQKKMVAGVTCSRNISELESYTAVLPYGSLSR